jgi:hypothetical protein
MTGSRVYVERVSSKRTEVLFVALTLLFLLLFAWRAKGRGFETWSVVFFCLFAFFLFYSLNYRTLLIRLTAEALHLKFGLFAWTIPFRNIEACFPDTTSLWRIGGAGLHFTPLGGRYRAMFNFLEHPRLVIALKVNKGPVQDIAFTTRRPEEVMRLVQEGAFENGVA